MLENIIIKKSCMINIKQKRITLSTSSKVEFKAITIKQEGYYENRKLSIHKKINYKLFCTKQHVVMEYVMENPPEIQPDKIKL